MRKPAHRGTANHRGLCYQNNLSHAEWALVEPMIPQAKRRGCRPRGEYPRGSERSSTCFRPVASGRRRGKACRPCARRIPTLYCGTGMAPWSASITRSMSRRASRRGERRARGARSSAPRPFEWGPHARPAELDVGKKVAGWGRSTSHPHLPGACHERPAMGRPLAAPWPPTCSPTATVIEAIAGQLSGISAILQVDD
jgi:hypothetical protein